MVMEKSEARGALEMVDRSRRIAFELSGYARAGDILIAWGVVWLLCNLLVQFLPERGFWSWPVGITAASLFSLRSGRGRSDWRVPATAATAFGFLVLVLAITGGEASAQNAITALLVAACYVMMGIWAGARFAWLGLLLAACVCIGWFAFPAWLYLWLGIGGGGAFIMAGLWLRRA